MKKEVINWLALAISVIVFGLSIVLFGWINTNNQRDVSTQLYLMAKVKCLETGDTKDCDEAVKIKKEYGDKIIKFAE